MTEIRNIEEERLKKVTGGAVEAGKFVCLNCGKEISAETVARYDGCCCEKYRKEFWGNRRSTIISA